MYILRELYRTSDSYYDMLSLGEHSTQYTSDRGGLRDMFLQIRSVDDTKKILLLDEQRFSWFATPLAFCAVKPCTVQDINKVIDPIITKYGWHTTEKLFYHIDGITVNGEATDYYMWKTWDIRCMMHIIALQRDDWYIAKSAFGKEIEQIRIYPSSFFTLHHIKQALHKDTGTLLVIGQYYTKRIVFTNGKYQTCEMLDLGWQVLKDIYGENNIRDFFAATKSEVSENTYAASLVEQSVRFYVDMLIRWLRSTQTTGNVFLVSDLVQNEYFMDMFSTTYQTYSQSFIVPLNHIKWLKTYGRKRWPEDIDLQTAAHYIV